MRTYYQSEGIIARPELLSEDYLPPSLLARDAQTDQLRFCLLPLVRRRKPLNAWLYGPPGSGKTSTARFVLQALEKESGTKSIYVNCWESGSLHAVLERILRALGTVGGVQQSTVLKLERLRLISREMPFIVALDEIDQPVPKERSNILYSLSMLDRVGMVAIANSKYALCSIEDRVLSRLQPQAIHFEQYTVGDLTDMLQPRAEAALAPGTWNREILEHVARLAQGDARAAVLGLKHAALRADAAGSVFLHHEFVREGWLSAQALRSSYRLSTLTVHHRLIYEIIRARPDILSGDLWNEYLRLCKRRKLRPIASRTFCDYPTKLASLDLITIQRAPIRGKVRTFRALDTIP